MASPTRRDVPATMLGSGEARPSNIVENIEASDDTGFQQLLDDIATMFERGRTDIEISEERGLPLDAVAYLRRRGDVSSFRD